MKRALVAAALILSFGVAARAQEIAQPDFFQRSMVAPDRAFELNVAAGYNQPWGDLTDATSATGLAFGRQAQDIAGAGIGFEVDLGFRSAPRFAAGLYGTFSLFSNQTDVSGTAVRSLTAGVQGTWYMLPFRAFSPWMTLGSGYRALWIIPDIGGSTRLEGWEAARLQLGTDFRLSKQVAIAPFVGGDFNIIFTEVLPNGASRSPNGPPVFFSFTAGILARFDAGGTFALSNGKLAPRDAEADAARRR